VTESAAFVAKQVRSEWLPGLKGLGQQHGVRLAAGLVISGALQDGLIIQHRSALAIREDGVMIERQSRHDVAFWVRGAGCGDAPAETPRAWSKSGAPLAPRTPRSRTAEAPALEGARQVEPNSSPHRHIQQDAPPLSPSTSAGSLAPHRPSHGGGPTSRAAGRASIIASGVRLRREPRPVPLAPAPRHCRERLARPRSGAGEGGRGRMCVAVALASVGASLSGSWVLGFAPFSHAPR